MREVNPFTHLAANALNSITGYNMLLHIGGAASTYVVVNTDIDRKVHNYFFKNMGKYNVYSVPAVYIGYLAPITIGSSMYLAGLYNDNLKNACVGSVILQSSLLGLIESSALKAFTGRQNPDSWVYNKNNDKSSNFRFGFLRNGIHYGWPSGHMCTSTAVVSGLTAFYLDNRFVRNSVWVVWAYMFLGVTVHEGNTMHWFSDIIAGSMMGYAIGNTVGKEYRKLYDGNKIESATRILINPVVSINYTGLQVKLKL